MVPVAGESCREAGSVVEGSSSSSSTRGSGRGQGAMEEEEEGEGSMLKGGHRQKESKGQTNFIRRNIEVIHYKDVNITYTLKLLLLL